MKAVVLLSKTFFPQHPKAGMKTYFEQKMLAGQIGSAGITIIENGQEKVIEGQKLHTCRSNFEYWKTKIERLKTVGGVLSVRQWSDKPYRSEQEVITDIPAEIVGIQKLTIKYGEHKFIPLVEGKIIFLPELAANDGMDTYNFINWFKPVFEKEKTDNLDFAIIHFTKFRY
jgi:hypothetical protein